MINKIKIYVTVVFALLLFGRCKEPFNPPLLDSGPRFLAITGFINTSNGGETKITISRTLKLNDTVKFIPETNALVKLIGSTGTVITLTSLEPGKYVSGALNLSGNNQYKITVTTVDGKNYESDFENNLPTPAIDSITWKQEKDVKIFLDTHDPNNSSRYYWWDFTETWQYQTPNSTIYGLNGNRIYVKSPAEQTTVCWKSEESTNLLLGTSAQLTDDVISKQPIHLIIERDKRIHFRYSVLIRQHVISATAYKYWKLIEQNSQNLGSLFDQQPSQIKGNIHSVSDPDEPVVGYISVATEQSKRIFIDHNDVTGWTFDPFIGYNCNYDFIPQNPDPYLYTYPDPNYVPWYFVTGGYMYVLPKDCLDCRMKGGTNIKPDFWQ